jgi:hypothetical protein
MAQAKFFSLECRSARAERLLPDLADLVDLRHRVIGGCKIKMSVTTYGHAQS